MQKVCSKPIDRGVLKVLVLMIALTSMVARTMAAEDRLPNIVLIVADDMGYADAGCNGSTDIRTPNLDQLAASGSRFTNFNVVQAVCTASRAALLSGCYPNRIGLAGALNHTSRTGINPDETLLSELCQARGYSCACFGKWHLGTRPEFDPLRHGFNQWLGLPYSNDNGPLHPTVRGIPALPWIENGRTVELDPDQSTFTRRLTEAALQFIDTNKDRPFFLYVPHVMPHVPIAASEAFKGKSSRGLYGDVVEELDWSIGEILGRLHAQGLDESTLVIFLSDNGPFLSYGDHAGSADPFREGKLTTFEGGVRVPFLLRWTNRIPANRVESQFMTGLDLFPTLAKIIGATHPSNKIDGMDLLPLWLGQPNATGRSEFAYYSGSELHAVRQGKWKMHFPHEYLTVNGPPGRGGKPANFEHLTPKSIEESGIRGIATRHGYRFEKLPTSLFNLEVDPGEGNNLVDKHPDVVAKLQALGESYRKQLGDTLTNVQGDELRLVGHVD